MSERKIKIVKDNKDKQNTYRTILPKYKIAIANKAYFEAVLINYALLEDRLTSILYHLALIKDRSDNLLYIGDKEILDICKIELNKKGVYCYDNITKKIDTLKRLFNWVEKTDVKYNKKSYLYLLKSECESIDIKEMRKQLGCIKKWCDWRNELIHGLLNKNIDDLYNNIESRVEEGYSYYKYLSNISKEIKVNSIIRKTIK